MELKFIFIVKKFEKFWSYLKRFVNLNLIVLLTDYTLVKLSKGLDEWFENRGALGWVLNYTLEMRSDPLQLPQGLQTNIEEAIEVAVAVCNAELLTQTRSLKSLWLL